MSRLMSWLRSSSQGYSAGSASTKGRACRQCGQLRRPNGGGTPVLVDAAGTVVDPWEMELLRWPAAAEAALRRGGYLVDRYPDPAELWCNCAD